MMLSPWGRTRVHVAQVLKQLFEDSRRGADVTGLLERAAAHLAVPPLSQVAILVQQMQPPHRVRACAAQGLSPESLKTLGSHAPTGTGAVGSAWPANLVPAELRAEAHFCAVPLTASQEQVTLVCDGPADLDDLSLVATFLALALERDLADFDARRLSDIFMAGRVVVFCWRNEAGWPVEFVSPNITKEFGYPLEKLLNQPYAPRVHRDDLQRVGAEVAEAMDRGVAYFAQQYRVLDEGGHPRDVYDFTHVIRDEDGKVTHFHGYVFDDGERVRAERAEAELMVQWQQTQKIQAVGTLASGIGHDFNNVLAAILGNLELARLEPALARNADLLAATQAALRGRDIVRQLLVFGRTRVEERLPHRLQRIIEDSMGMMRSTIPSTIGLRLSLDPKTPAVLADAAQLQQVLVNLVTNAADAMPQGGTVEIALTTRPGQPPHAELAVKDVGQGMTPEVLNRAFEPFFTTKGVGKGPGLGLSMVHSIITAHGGTVTLHSAPGVGTTVLLSLPVCPGEEASPAPSQVDLPPGRQQRIVLVDDEPLVARAAERLIAHFGYAVTTMSSAREVLAAFAERPDAFELVLTDQTMPEMTGLQLTEALRARGIQVPVLLVTGLPMEINAASSAVTPPFTVLGKPYRSEELSAALAALLPAAGPK